MLWWLGGGLAAFLMVIGSLLGYLENPWTPWQLAGRNSLTISLNIAPPDAGVPGDGSVDIPGLPAGSVPIGAPSVPVAPGNLTDHARYLLALAAGWSSPDALTMTAISIAENGPGNPTLRSPINPDGRTFDFGILQINSAHFAECGGIAALADPLTNFRCGYRIWLRQGFFGWCTYPGGCGGGPGSPSWPQALVRARAAAYADSSNQA